MDHLEDDREITSGNIGGGIIEELFSKELDKVLLNISDINTARRKVRTISIKVSFRPSEDRSETDIFVDIVSSLAPKVSYVSRAKLGKAKGKIIAVEYQKPRQLSLFDEEKEDTEMRRVK